MSKEIPFDDKEKQFDDLWEGRTPKGINRTKALKFRQTMMQHLLQVRRLQNRENARKYWLGQLQQEIREAEGF